MFWSATSPTTMLSRPKLSTVCFAIAALLARTCLFLSSCYANWYGFWTAFTVRPRLDSDRRRIGATPRSGPPALRARVGVAPEFDPFPFRQGELSRLCDRRNQPPGGLPRHGLL